MSLQSGTKCVYGTKTSYQSGDPDFVKVRSLLSGRIYFYINRFIFFNGIILLGEISFNRGPRFVGKFFPHVNTSLDVHKEVSNKLLQPWSVDFIRTLSSHTANKYTFKVNTRNNRKRCEICSKLTIFSSFLWLL